MSVAARRVSFAILNPSQEIQERAAESLRHHRAARPGEPLRADPRRHAALPTEARLLHYYRHPLVLVPGVVRWARNRPEFLTSWSPLILALAGSNPVGELTLSTSSTSFTLKSSEAAPALVRHPRPLQYGPEWKRRFHPSC